MNNRREYVKLSRLASGFLVSGLLIISLLLPIVSPSVAASGDFIVSVPYPATSPVLPGTGVTLTVYINSTGGFVGTVNLSVSASPAGVLVSITPSVNVLSGGYNTAQLGITTNSAPAATYTITVTGVSGSLTHSTTTTLVVLPNPPSFTVTASPSSMTLQAGSGSSSTLTITSLYGFSGSVSLPLAVYPQVTPWPTPFNVTATVSPATVNISKGNPATATVVVQTAVSTPTGHYSVWVNAEGGGQIHQAFIQVGVGPYFTMSASPTSLTIPAGQSGSSTILLTSHANFSFTANFQMTVNLPGPLITCPPYCPIYPQVSISPSTVNLPALGTATTVLTISTAANTTQGTYTITIFGGGCVCLLPTISVTATVTSPHAGNVNQTLSFDGVIAVLTGNLTSTSNAVYGTIWVTVTNATTGAILFSKSFTISFVFVSTNNPRFVMIIPRSPYTLGITCSVNTSNSQSSCFLSRDPNVSHSGAINIIDVGMMSLAFGTIAGSPNFNPALDLAAQGFVSLVDFGIVAADFGAPLFT